MVFIGLSGDTIMMTSVGFVEQIIHHKVKFFWCPGHHGPSMWKLVYTTYFTLGPKPYDCYECQVCEFRIQVGVLQHGYN